MRLSNKAVKDFTDLYLKQNGVILSAIEAEGLALEFLNFFKLIYKPIPIRDKNIFLKSPMYEL